jgi:hypothetical protein
MRTGRFIAALAAACVAGGFATHAHAFFVFTQPTPPYVSSTNLIDISGLSDGDEVSFIADSGLTVAFATLMMRLTVPDSWNTWNTPSFTETDTPPVLWSEEATAVLLSLSVPQLVFGFEAQPDASDVETLVATFFDDTHSPIGAIARDVSGNGGALLFAASSHVPIASVLLVDQADSDFAIANVRYSSQFLAPLPPTIALVALGCALLLAWRRAPAAQGALRGGSPVVASTAALSR